MTNIRENLLARRFDVRVRARQLLPASSDDKCVSQCADQAASGRQIACRPATDRILLLPAIFHPVRHFLTE